MKRTLRLFLLFVFVSSSSLPAFSQNGEKPVSVSSPVYRHLDNLLTLNGVALPTRTGPYTAQEILHYVDTLQTETLDATSLDLVAEIRRLLRIRSLYGESSASGPGLVANLEQELNPEAYAYGGSSHKPWRYGYDERPSLYSLRFEAWAFSNAFATFDMEIKKDPFAVIDQKNPIANFPQSLGELDFMWPYESGLVLGGDHWDFRIYRSAMNWGAGLSNLVLAPDGGSMDQIMLTSWWSNFKYVLLWIPMDNYTLDTSRTHYGYYNTVEDKTNNDPKILGSKNFIVHHLDFRFWDTWRLGMSEITMTVGLDPRYLFPMFPGHNWFLQSNANSDLIFDLETTPIRGWTVYGQWYGDYIKTSFKDAVYSDPNPPAFGYVLGTRVVFPAHEAIARLDAEAVYVDPFFRLNQHVDMIHTVRFQSNYDGSEGLGVRQIDRPFAFAPGNDAIFATLKFSMERVGAWSWFVETPFLAQGEMTIREKHPLESGSVYTDRSVYNTMTTPTGTAEISQSLVVGGTLDEKSLPFPWKSSLGLRAAWTTIWNTGHVPGKTTWDLQCALTWRNTF